MDQHEKQEVRFQIPLVPVCSFQIEKDENDFKKGLESDSVFPTWAKVEKQGSGSKPLWDQFGPFQNDRDQNDSKRVCNLTPFSPTWGMLLTNIKKTSRQ
jgi:hypothetical protein